MTGWTCLLYQANYDIQAHNLPLISEKNSPVVENSKMEKAEHEDKLAGMEELETEHVGDEDKSNEGAQLPEKTDPIPLKIVGTNPESQGSVNVITSSRDE